MSRHLPFLLFTALVVVPPGWGSQQPRSHNPDPQDVPQQTPQGTNNPDIWKQRRPGPVPPRAQNPNQQSDDVPRQETGPDNPDLGKQRAADKSGPVKSYANGTSTSTASSRRKHSGRGKAKSKSTKTTTASS